MGIDFLDCIFRIEKDLGFSLANLQYHMHDAPRNRWGTLSGATAADLARWVERLIVAQQRPIPPDLWPRIRACIAATIGAESEEIAQSSRLIEDLGFT